MLLAGLPGTGKSTLARLLAGRLGGVVLDKDQVRAAMFPGTAVDYSDAQNALAMRALYAAADYLTVHQGPPFVFVDGRTFTREAQRLEAIEAARRAGAAWRLLLLRCTEAVARRRLAAPAPEHPALDRGWELYQRQQAVFEPLKHPTLEIDASEGYDPAVEQIAAYLTD